jgi:cell division protein FtsQ
MAVRAPADKRFRRAHASPTRKRRLLPANWKAAARPALVLAVGLYLAYRVVTLVASADALVIERITVNGNVHLSRGEVVALLDGLRGRNMVTTGLETWRQKLKSSPWVADAAIRRVLPGTIAVVILEREPIGIGRLGEDLYLIDRQGSVIDAFGPNYAGLDLPIIDGLSAGPKDGGLLVDQGRAALAIRVLDALAARPALASRISEVDVTDPHDALVILKDDTTVVRVGDDQFVKRLESYLSLSSALRERVPEIDYVDLRFDERVYVRPQLGRQSSGSGRESRR